MNLNNFNKDLSTSSDYQDNTTTFNKKTAFVFPGQGSQSIGMLTELAGEFPELKETYLQANEILNIDLWRLSQEGPTEIINQTELVQPLLLTAGYAVWKLWIAHSRARPSILAGHSLGEFTALVCAEALDFTEALKLVRDRGKFMQEAVPLGKGAMVAIAGLSDDVIAKICQDAAGNEILNVANYNSIGQTVLSGETSAIERSVILAKAASAKLVKILPVSVPSHSIMMRNAAEKFAQRLFEVQINKPKIPIIHNADVCSYGDPELIRRALVKQLYSPVRWVETILLIANQGVNVILECGPGKVLTGLNKRIVSDLSVDTLHMPAGFKNAMQNFI